MKLVAILCLMALLSVVQTGPSTGGLQLSASGYVLRHEHPSELHQAMLQYVRGIAGWRQLFDPASERTGGPRLGGCG